MKPSHHHRERGAILALVAISLPLIIALVAFAIDINHLYVVRNELQNAADAGALAGAGSLYKDAGKTINTGANGIAYNTARLNQSDKLIVDIHWPTGNLATDDIQRGHWSFNPSIGTDNFTPSNSTTVVNLWGVSDDDLDKMDGVRYVDPVTGNKPVFINAVKVTTRREDQPAISFFANLFGFESFIMQADAVAMIGFAGSLGPLEAEQPIVLCEETLKNDQDEYECNIGRMLDSGASCPPNDPTCTTSINTAGWTDMQVLGEASDTFQCTSTAPASAVSGLVCSGGANSTEIEGGDMLQATNGVQGSSYNDFKSCWEAASNSEHPYQMKLPVVNCGSGNSVDNCVEVVGAVTVNMLYMSDQGTAKPQDAPTSMTNVDIENLEFDDWSYDDDCSDDLNGRSFKALVTDPPQSTYNALVALNGFPERTEDVNGNTVYTIIDTDRWLANERWQGESVYTEGMARWDCFVDHFNLINTNNKMAPLAHKAMYFMPDCTPHEPTGNTGGSNFGVLAKYPVLVE